MHIAKGNHFMKMKIEKINELSNFKFNLTSNINKIRDNAIDVGSRDPFQDLEYSPKQQW